MVVVEILQTCGFIIEIIHVVKYLRGRAVIMVINLQQIQNVYKYVQDWHHVHDCQWAEIQIRLTTIHKTDETKIVTEMVPININILKKIQDKFVSSKIIRI